MKKLIGKLTQKYRIFFDPRKPQGFVGDFLYSRLDESTVWERSSYFARWLKQINALQMLFFPGFPEFLFFSSHLADLINLIILQVSIGSRNPIYLYFFHFWRLRIKVQSKTWIG